MRHERLDSFKRFVLTVVVAIQLSPQPVFAQARLLHVTENEKAQQAVFSSNYTTLKSTFSDSVMYYAPQYPRNNKIELYTYNIQTRESGTMRIENPKNAKILLSERIESLAVNGSKMVVISSDHILVFRLLENNSMRCEGVTANKYLFKKCLPLGNHFLLYVNYNYHPMDAPDKHVWATFDADKRELMQVKFPSDENSMFGSLVNSWIDTRGEKIVYADPLTYAITFYNDKLEATDSIRLDELDNNETYVAPFRKANLNSKDAVQSLMNTDDSLLTRIRKVYYLNDSTVMALICRPEKVSVRADYWQKLNGSWTRIRQDYSTPWFAEGGSYSKDSLTYTDFLQNVYDFPYLGNYTFAEAYFPYIPTIATSNFNRNNDYFKLQNEAIQQHEAYFGIKQIHIDLPAR